MTDFMPDPNPQYGRPRKRRDSLTIRGHLGTCLWCRHGVYLGDDVTRGRGKWLGLLHQHCADKLEEKP